MEPPDDIPLSQEVGSHLSVVGRNPRELRDATDDELTLLVRHNHQSAMRELLRRHQPLVTGYAVRFLGDRALAREVTQEVFIAAWERRKKYRPRDKFRNYVLSLAYYRCQQAVRKRTAVRRTSDRARQLQSDPEHSQTPLERLIAAARAEEVRQELRRLRGPARHLIILRYVQDLSLQEIAEQTGRPIGTVKSNISRGLRKLANALKAAKS